MEGGHLLAAFFKLAKGEPLPGKDRKMQNPHKKNIPHIMRNICSLSDPGGIQTPDLQNRNLTFYSAELRGRTRKSHKGIMFNHL
jgi:hypothetical protein